MPLAADRMPNAQMPVSAHFLSHPGAAMLRVVDVGDGEVATRLNVADPEVPGRVGISLRLFPRPRRWRRPEREKVRWRKHG